MINIIEKYCSCLYIVSARAYHSSIALYIHVAESGGMLPNKLILDIQITDSDTYQNILYTVYIVAYSIHVYCS